MIEYFIIGFLVLLVGTLGYAVFNLTRKLEVYEDWVSYFKIEVQKVYIRLKQTDEKNLFEKDDDVGWLWSEILRIVDEFNKRIK